MRIFCSAFRIDTDFENNFKMDTIDDLNMSHFGLHTSKRMKGGTLSQTQGGLLCV